MRNGNSNFKVSRLLLFVLERRFRELGRVNGELDFLGVIFFYKFKIRLFVDKLFSMRRCSL